MDLFSGLLLGFKISLTLVNVLYCFIGVLIGTLVGVLPGIGAIGAMSLLLPLTFGMEASSALIILAGIYYGAQYGGSTTSILVNIPGEGGSVITCLDGYQMALKGRAGAALGISAIGSFVAGTLGVLLLMLFSFPIARFALKFGPPEIFSLMFLGLTLLSYLARGSMLKALCMGLAGILLSSIGIDIITGFPRFTLGMVNLIDGIDLVPIAMGLFGISEVIANLEEEVRREVFDTKVRGLLPDREEMRRSRWPILRGAVLGFFLGIMPGGGAVTSSIISYTTEKKLSRYPEKFGTGMIEGVAGPEAANNSCTAGAFVPLLTMGIPTHVSMALLMGAMMIHNVVPGPLFLKEHPDIFWGVITSMYIGNILLLILNLPLIGVWVKVLKVPYSILFPLILLFCIIGAYSLQNSVFDIMVLIFFGFIGYFMRKLHYGPAPLILAYILGPKMEQALRQSLLIFQGNFTGFFVRPICIVSLGLALILIVSNFVPVLRRERLRLPVEDEEPYE